MSVNYRASTSAQNQSTTASATIPGSSQAGDVAIALMHTGASADPAVPSGFTQIGTFKEFGGISNVAMLIYKVLGSGDVGAAISIPITASGTPKWVMGIAVYSGVDNAAPIEASSFTGETVSQLAHTTPSVTVTDAGCWLVSGVTDRGSGSSTTFTPSTATIRTSSYGAGGGSVSLAMGDSNGATATGSVSGGTYTGTTTTATATMFSVSLKPSSAVVATATAKVPGQVTKLMLDALLALGTPRAVLLDASYTFDRDNHVHYSDIIAHELPTGSGYTSGGQALTTVTTAYDATNDRVVLKCDDPTWTPGVSQTLNAGFMAIIVKTSLASTSPFALLIDFGGLVSSDGPLSVTPDSTDGFTFVRVAPGS